MAAEMSELLTPGTFIRVRREEMNLSLQDVADPAELTPSFLARVEKDMHIPSNAKTIRSIEKSLHIDEGYLRDYFEHWKSERSLRNLKNFMNLIRISIKIMKESQFIIVSRIDHRIRVFDEDKRLLASNFIEYLSGDLRIDEKPENGLRPLCHYFDEFSPEINNKWIQNSSSFKPPRDFKKNAGLRGEPNNDNHN